MAARRTLPYWVRRWWHVIRGVPFFLTQERFTGYRNDQLLLQAVNNARGQGRLASACSI
jgi:hypothetical protein